MAASTFVLKQEHLRLLGPGNLDQSPVTLNELTIRERSKWAAPPAISAIIAPHT